MTTLLNNNPRDPMFQAHVNLWHSTLDQFLKNGADLEASIEAADKAVKAIKKRFKYTPPPVSYDSQESAASH